VTGFKDGKPGAFSTQLDHGAESQVVSALPALNAQGLVATFYVNPGTERYEIVALNGVKTAQLEMRPNVAAAEVRVGGN
jgi:hypothetical protein